MRAPRSGLTDVPHNSTLRWLIDHLRMPMQSMVGKTMIATKRLEGLRGGVVECQDECVLQPKYGKSYRVHNKDGIDLIGPFAAHLVPTEQTCKAIGLTVASFPIWGSTPGGIVLNATAASETDFAYIGVRLTAGPTRGKVLEQMYKVQTLSNKKSQPALKWFNTQEEALDYKQSSCT